MTGNGNLPKVTTCRFRYFFNINFIYEPHLRNNSDDSVMKIFMKKT